MGSENGYRVDEVDLSTIHLKVDGLEKEFRSAREDLKKAADSIVAELREVRKSLVEAITSLVKTMGIIVVVLVVCLTGLKYLVPHVLQ